MIQIDYVKNRNWDRPLLWFIVNVSTETLVRNKIKIPVRNMVSTTMVRTVKHNFLPWIIS